MRNKTALVILTGVILLLLVGCAPEETAMLTPAPTTDVTTVPTETPTPTPVTETPTTTAPTSTIPTGDYKVDINRVKENNWAMFGGIAVNYTLGVQVDKSTEGYQPFYIVNRYNEMVETLQVRTYPDETTADIPIRKLLHEGNLSNVTGIDSSLPADRLVVTGYVAGTNSLTITGFTPSVTRRVTIKYRPDTVYRVTLANEKNKDSALSQYFTVEQERITVAPNSYSPIDYSFLIPEDTIVPDKFRVYIYAEPVYVTGGGMSFNIGYYATIEINMN